MKDIYILAIETTCDETSVAIVKNGKNIIAETVLTQMDTHANFGGVVPEIASRMHSENITMVLEETLSKSNIKLSDIDAVAVAYAPGLLGALFVGIEFAKCLSYYLKKPLIKVNHLIGHIYASKIENEFTFPSLAVVVSGGHTEMVIMNDDYDFTKLGSTLDDAIGEAFDKVARVIGIPYPGGPGVEQKALLGNHTYKLPNNILKDNYDFSYSGLKSSVINIVNIEKMKGNEINVNDLARSFQDVAVNQITTKINMVLENYDIKNVILAGGVSANKFLREEVLKLCKKKDTNLLVPSLKYSTDNAAMIGVAAYPLFIKGEFASFDLNASSNADIV